MAAPEESIRRYLDDHGGSVEVSVRQAVSSWRVENPTLEDRARIGRALAAAGVEASPPLDQGTLDSRVTLRVTAPPRGTAAPSPGPQPATAPQPAAPPRPSGAGQRPSPGAPGRPGAPAPARPGLGDDRLLLGALAAGVVGLLLALGPDRIYGYALVLGVVAVALLVARGGLSGGPALRGVRLTWVAGALGALALVLGVVASFTLDSSATPGATQADAAERKEFCTSQTGEELDRLGVSGTGSPEELREATDAVLDRTQDAPAGAPCAVFALDALSASWKVFANFPGYDDAEEQIERIRQAQGSRGLTAPVF